MKILVADDDTTIRNLINEVLSGSGHEVDLAIDGLQAIEFIRGQQYDYVFTDINMPKADGLQVMREAKKAQDSKCKIVLIPGAVVEEVAEIAREENVQTCGKLDLMRALRQEYSLVK